MSDPCQLVTHTALGKAKVLEDYWKHTCEFGKKIEAETEHFYVPERKGLCFNKTSQAELALDLGNE